MKKYLILFSVLVSGCAVGLTSTPGINLYEDGQYEEAQKLLEDEISNGTVQANYALGLMYLDGNGVDKDLLKAESMLLDGSMAGDHRAVKGLIRFYEENERCETDRLLASKWKNFSILYRNMVSSRIEIFNAYAADKRKMAELYQTPCPNARYFEKVHRQFDAWSRIPRRS